MRNEYSGGSATKANAECKIIEVSRLRDIRIQYSAALSGQWSFFRSNGNKNEARATWRAALKGGRMARVYAVRGNVNHTSK